VRILGSEHGPAPSAKCSCGFYGRYDIQGALYQGGDVTGVIEVSGRVILGTKGVRAERARIVALAGAPLLTRFRYSGVKHFRNPSLMVEEFPPPDMSALLPPELEPPKRLGRFTWGGLTVNGIPVKGAVIRNAAGEVTWTSWDA
jgi:hypothetical protein